MLTVIERARRYTRSFQPAISGQGGHNTTLALASRLTYGFNLNIDQALPIMEEWNEKLAVKWSKSELLHKLEDGSLGKGQSRPRGFMLKDDKRRSNYIPSPIPQIPSTLRTKPDRNGFGTGTVEQLKKLSLARPYGLPGLAYASERGLLVFGSMRGWDCYGVMDQSGNILEVRRMDGEAFPALGSLVERKSHTLKGSQKAWPVGILEAASFPCIALVEGIPDFLEAHNAVLRDDKRERVAPVAMLSAAPSIAGEALPHFKSKRVRIFPHNDKAGIQGAAKWQKQLREAGATIVDVFDFAPYTMSHGGHVNDLYDLRSVANLGLEGVLP